MAEQTPQEWTKFEQDGEANVRRKLALGLYNQRRIRLAEAWLAHIGQQPVKRRSGHDKRKNDRARTKRQKRRLNVLKVFMSYYHTDKRLAGKIRAELQDLGIDVFLAHEDINPSHEWRNEILKELLRCHAFLPVLTRRFHKSEWTDQETGLAIAKRKVVIPLKVDMNPYGFAERYQAFTFSRKRPAESCSRLFRTIQATSKLRSRAVNSLSMPLLEARALLTLVTRQQFFRNADL